MTNNEIVRFNVYARYESATKTEKFWLECMKEDQKWSSVTHQGNLLEYRSLNQVASRIKELLPANHAYLRIISEENPQEQTGLLKGIILHENTCPTLSRELTAQEKKDLTDLICKLTTK
jgi:hypothetical protein